MAYAALTATQSSARMSQASIGIGARVAKSKCVPSESGVRGLQILTDKVGVGAPEIAKSRRRVGHRDSGVEVMVRCDWVHQQPLSRLASRATHICSVSIDLLLIFFFFPFGSSKRKERLPAETRHAPHVLSSRIIVHAAYTSNNKQHSERRVYLFIAFAI